MSTVRKEKEIDIHKKYQFPSNIQIVHYNSRTIIISVDTAKWIVLDNQEQIQFYELLKEHTLEQALNLFKGKISNAQYVVIQLEARRFEDQEVMLKNDTIGMHLYLTNSCNMRCPHCYMYAGNALENELTTEELQKLLKTFKDNGGDIVTFSGGEICMRKDLFEMISYTRQINLRCELLTNGTLWNEEQIKAVARYLYRVQISIDGYSEETNAAIRGKGNFAKALHTTEQFLNAGARVDIAITPWYSEALKHNYLKYADFGLALMKKYEGYPFSIKFNNDLLDGRELKLTPAQKNEYRALIDKINAICFGDIEDIPFINFHKKNGIENNCDYGNLTVNSNGDLFFCAALPMKKPFANLRKDSVEEIIRLARKAKQASDVNNLMPCRECELKYICGGDCRILYFPELADGDIDQINGYPTRECDQSVKEKFYELMIRTNQKLFQ